jgi:hypothetical protein
VTSFRGVSLSVAALLVVTAGLGVLDGRQMDVRQASGIPLPASDIPAGTVSVRVVRDSFANNLSGVEVEFDVAGRITSTKTDAGGRAQVENLAVGTTVRARAMVDGKLLETQPVTIGQTGIRFVLVAGDGSAEASGPSPKTPGGAGFGAAVPGSVSFGGSSRVVAEYSDERLNIYYVLQILNAAAGPVDIGSPLIVELPTGARGATIVQGTTGKATANGAHITIVGPFAPGTTNVNIGFELPFTGEGTELTQKWPAAMPATSFFALPGPDAAHMDASSSVFSAKQATTEQGVPVIVAAINAIPKGETLTIRISGLPHHSMWPRNVALGLGGVLTLFGIVAAVLPVRRRVA